MSGSNYKNRRARGQCASCTNQSTAFRCEQCRARLREYNKSYGKEYRFRKSMEREKRLDEIIAQSAADIARLEKELAKCS